MEAVFNEVYTKFRINLYKKLFGHLNQRTSSLTAVETFCIEAIHAMGRPTIRQFADFVEISQANAAYKVAKLISKGYLRKVHSAQDRREYHLEVTEKYMKRYGARYEYVAQVMRRIRERFTPEEVDQLEWMLRVIGQELMP